MSRQLRIEYTSAMYRVINRCNFRSWIFEDEGAKKSFEKALFESGEFAGWRLHAFLVMGNHFNLALETPEANLSNGMRWPQSVFANRFNRYRKEKGKLFQVRFKSLFTEDRVCLSESGQGRDLRFGGLEGVSLRQLLVLEKEERAVPTFWIWVLA